MKLKVRFLQLPIQFNARLLADEISALPTSAWRPHPQGYPGNDFLPLITSDGDPASDSRGGAMSATPYLTCCPYLMQVLEALGATWGRSRLMRLSGDAEVTAHVDTAYYWRDHMRVHVPIVTQPSVRFSCGSEDVHMAAGECWIFDTWSLHSVHNGARSDRIHLVADTVGGDGFLNLIENGRSPGENRADWRCSKIEPYNRQVVSLAFERLNKPEVMTPWELKDHLGFLMSEIAPGQAQIGQIGQVLNRLRVNWHALWAQYGDAEHLRPAYSAALETAARALERLHVDSVILKNQVTLGRSLEALIFKSAVAGDPSPMDADTRSGPVRTPSIVSNGQAGAARSGRDPLFDRPVFIISTPRSGSTLLFETLGQASNIATVGGEAHRLIESVPEASPAMNGWSSNRLTAADATPKVIEQLREKFSAHLKTNDGMSIERWPVRMLEKTPKNALRIPFLAKVFPEAQFVYLHRDPRPTLASMMEAWLSDNFCTYRQLPEWTGLPWSLLLVPGWRDLAGAPLEKIVAHQWKMTTRILLEDLHDIPVERVRTISYEALIADPQRQILELCQSLDLGWNLNLDGELPLAQHTVSAPGPEKWRAYEAKIEAVMPFIMPECDRARSMLC